MKLLERITIHGSLKCNRASPFWRVRNFLPLQTSLIGITKNDTTCHESYFGYLQGGLELISTAPWFTLYLFLIFNLITLICLYIFFIILFSPRPLLFLSRKKYFFFFIIIYKITCNNYLIAYLWFYVRLLSL